MVKLTRRNFAKFSLAGVAALTVPQGSAMGGEGPAAPFLTGPAGRPAPLAPTKGQRAVVVGGGWSGLTLAKYLKKFSPALDVILIERKETFVSHPMSNLWLAGLIDLATLTHSFHDAARHNDYTYFNASVFDVDRQSRKVFTDKGTISYDFLILAPGIDYDYASFGVHDPRHENLLKSRYPAGFISGSEHITLRNKINAFTGGVFVLTAPPGIYRCTATPYERACLIASVFKRNKVKGKVVLIDPRSEPGVNAEGFLAAFKDLYGDVLEYMVSTEVKTVDPEQKTISNEFDNISFDDAAIYPRIRGARLIETLGLMDPKSSQKEAAIDPFTYHVPGDKRVYVTGDSRPMPFSKSANVARTEGVYVAKVIAARATGKEVPWESPRSLCYSVVNAAPEEAIMINTTYKLDPTSHEWGYAETHALNQRTESLSRDGRAWARDHFRDMFS
ncbi:MAG: NAD(P)/FAD-dependent oxidoreductase [Rhodospirillales bacterium]|nr:NAD(P)/FAD-dependent oxidoreductase [Rhodospirillales bacterium]